MNWSFVIPLLALLAIKLVGTTLFLRYFSQILSTTTPLEEVPSSNDGPKACQIGWQPFQGSCYQFSALEDTWENSRKDCKGSGADLAVVKSTVELNFLKTETTNANYLIGLKRDSNGIWKWIDGTDLNQNIINIPGEDNDCAVVGVGHTGSVRCSVKTRWICEKILVNRY